MANLNINRQVTDQFYRYKMPRIIAKVEGKGNGIKTVIVNMTEIAKSLSRPPTYPTKYFGCELGAQTQFDGKNERYIVNGAHDASKLQDLLDGFIKRFVLCPECDNPETNLAIKERKGMILQRCIACGHQANVDMRHKLTTYILKNPPGGEEQEKKKEKKDKGKKGQENGDHSPEPGDKEHKLDKEDGSDDDEDWGEDLSEEAVNKRMMELTDAAKGMTMSDDLEKTEKERVNLFYEFVKEKKTSSMTGGKFPAIVAKEIAGEADRLEVKDKAPMVLVELLFDANILQQIKDHRTLFLLCTGDNPKAQKYLLGGFEQLVGKVYKDALMPKVAHILKSFYDHDILVEEVILDWDKKVSKKYVSKEVAKEIHEKSTPFIKWLQEAEEESSDEDDDDVQVEYSHTEKVGIKTIPKDPAQKKDTEKDEAEEDDFDIDAI
eukprot:GHVU01217839.1.p1 GENE.GHVU01217839.1~~GHVU01217839.1.p1  ORF type:complete len:435 (+),score=99.70 GHVU01217839.1:328-1632(+)